MGGGGVRRELEKHREGERESERMRGEEKEGWGPAHDASDASADFGHYISF